MSFERYFIGVDLGKMQDYTALCAIEWAWTPTRVPSHYYRGRPIDYRQGQAFKEYRTRYLERVKIGTAYHEIAEKVKHLQEQIEQSSPGEVRTHVAVDATGVGRPVTEMLKRSGVRNLTNITITGGNAPQRVASREWHVPKRDLVSTVQVLLQNRKLLIAAGLPDADILRRELTNFKAKISLSGHDTYEAWREGDHDDLVLSVALAVWLAEHGKIDEWTREDLQGFVRPF